MLERFHNEDYDGIVLKIPRFFIEMNELEEPLAQLLAKLKACNKSKFLPEHLSNIKELEEYKEKIEQLNSKKALEEERRKQAEEQLNRIVAGDEVILEWEKRNAIFYETIALSKDDRLDVEDCLTRKSVKSDIERQILEKCKTYEGLKQFSKDNGYDGTELLIDLKESSSELFNLHNVRVYNSNKGGGGLGISYERLFARTQVIKKDDGGYRFFSQRLHKSADGIYYIDDKEKTNYAGFQIHGSKLIKKKQEPNGNKES